jgi:S-(hydroxymethyl)glutathione dehydrogenase/alcohol dehydrogenase
MEVMSMQFKAAVLHAVGAPLVLETVEAGPMRPDDVLVKVGAASLCHTDLEVMLGRLAMPMPIVLGHEAAGVIMDVGANVPRARIGERVVLSWNPHCGRCFHCEHGQPILCDDYVREGPRGRQRDGTSRLALDRKPLATMFFTAAFAEFAIVESHCAVRIPDAIPLERACLIGCAVMTGVGAAAHIADISFGSSVAVVGCGGVGLAAVQGARLAGASIIIAADPIEARLGLAATLGATHLAEPGALATLARQVTAGRGADVVIESAGTASSLALSVECCRAGGQVIWLGKLAADDRLSLRWGSLMGEKRIQRSSYGGARPQEDFPALAKAYLDGRLLLDELVTQELPLRDINVGFEALRRGQVVRTVVTM